MPQTFRLRGKPGTPAYSFTVSAPYSAGYELDEAEALALNAMRAERIQDRVRGKEFARELSAVADGEMLDEAALARVKAVITTLDATFSFGGGRTRVQYNRQSSIEAEARRIAEQMIYETPANPTEALIAEVAAQPQVVAEATERVKAKAKLAATSMDEMLA